MVTTKTLNQAPKPDYILLWIRNGTDEHSYGVRPAGFQDYE